MRAKVRPGAKNFVEVVFPDYSPGTVPDCHNTEAALSEKKTARLEAVSQTIDKYQTLNGRYPAFFLEPERYKGTN